MNPSVQVKSDHNGTKLIATTIIDAPQTAVWDILKHPGKVAEFHPLIKKSYMTTEAQNGMGAKRHCDLLPMGEFNEVITEWEEGNAFTIEVTDGKMLPPHHFMKGRFALEKKRSQDISNILIFLSPQIRPSRQSHGCVVRPTPIQKSTSAICYWLKALR